MGSSLSSLISQYAGDSDDDSLIRDHLTTLYNLGKTRSDTAVNQALAESNQVYAPISKILYKKQRIVCDCSTKPPDIAKGIKTIMGDFMSGNIMDGVCDIVSGAMDVILESSSGQTTSESEYALIATDIGGLLRLDVDIYDISTSLSRVMSSAKHVTAFTVLISSVVLDKITAGDLRAITSLKYCNSSVDLQQAIFDQVLSAWSLDKQGAAGVPVSPEDVQRHKSLWQPSRYLEQWEAQVLQLGESSTALSSPKYLTYKQKTLPGRPVADVNGTTVGAMTIDLSITFVLAEEWNQSDIRVFSAMLSAFSTSELQLVGIKGQTAGTAVSFAYQLTYNDFEEYRAWIGYLNNEVIPACRNNVGPKYIAAGIECPASVGPSIDIYTIIRFINNKVQNNTGLRLYLVAPKSANPSFILEPGEEKRIDFDIRYIKPIVYYNASHWVTMGGINGNPRNTVIPQGVACTIETIYKEEYNGLAGLVIRLLGVEGDTEGDPATITYNKVAIGSPTPQPQNGNVNIGKKIG